MSYCPIVLCIVQDKQNNKAIKAENINALPAQAGAQSRAADDGGQRAVTSVVATGPASGRTVPRTVLEHAGHAQPDAPSPGKQEGKKEAEDWDTAFLAGLCQALTTFAAPLLGGDTVSLPAHAPRVITLTAIGANPAAPVRAGARAGDTLWVTGTIGDAGAGLAIALGREGPAELLAAYRRPQPRITEGQALAAQVHAMMDVSDGLLIDAERMAAASGLAVTIDLARIPLSDAYRIFAGEDRAARLAATTAGDDYQLLFALPPGVEPAAAATCIGHFAAGRGLTLHDAGAPVALPPALGYQHGD